MNDNLQDGEWLRIYFGGQWLEGNFMLKPSLAANMAAMFLKTGDGLSPQIARIQTTSIDAIERRNVEPS